MSDIAESGHNAGAVLLGLVERIERVDEEKKALAADRREILSEAKAFGLDKTIVNQVVKIRAMDPQKRSEQEALVAAYIDSIAAASGG